MKITRKTISRIIFQEVRQYLREFADGEPSEDDDETGTKKPKKPKTADAADSPAPKAKGSKKRPDPVAKNDPTSPADSGDDIDGPSVTQPDPESDEDGENERPESDDQAAIDADGDGGEEPSGVVNDELSGKTVQAITIEPRSKVLPGAKEIILAFNESTDTLRILVTATGTVKFFWRGQLHDIP